MNPFAQYLTNRAGKPYRGIPISRLEEFKKFRRAEQVQWRYVFRGPRLRDQYGQSAGMTLKSNAHSFDVYFRY